MSNCLFFVISRWLKRGGYIVIRKSHVGWWPHFLWSPDLETFQQFVPVNYNPELLIPPLLFRGIITTKRATQKP